MVRSDRLSHHAGRWAERRGPGWRSTFTLSVTQTVGFGVLSFAFSVLLVPMQEDLGVSRGGLTSAFGLTVAVRAVLAPVLGGWIDRRGARSLMSVGSVLAVGAVLAWSMATTLTQLVVVYIVLGIAGAGALYEPAFALIARWFEGRERTDAVLFVTTIAGFASTIFFPLTAVLTDAFGWRGALRWLALILAICTVLPHALLLRDPTEQLDGPDGPRTAARPPDGVALRDALADPALRWLIAGFVAATLPIMSVSAHLPAMLIERGEATTFAAALAGGIGIAKVVGRLLLGAGSRRWSFPLLLTGVFALQSLALTLLAFGAGRITSVAFVITFGIGAGSITIARPLIIAASYGRRSYGAIAGVVALLVNIAQAVGPALAGFGHDMRGDYRDVLLVLALCAAIAAACMLRTDRRPGVEAVAQSAPPSDPSAPPAHDPTAHR